MIKDPDEKAAKLSIQVMIELFKKRVWNDENTVNVISEGCMHRKSTLAVAACKFFLVQIFEVATKEEDDDESDDEDIHKIMEQAKAKGMKHSKKRQGKLETALKSLKRKEKRRSRRSFIDFLPVDMIKNPAELGEKLFDRLKKQNDRFEVKLVIMKMLARVIGRHKLMILGFYTYISKYINPHQKEVSDILAVFCEGTHENIPAEEIHPVMDKIIDLYISEQVANNNICIAINAVREICMRNHEALREDQLHHVANFRMRHKSIGAAVKSLINLYRDINP